MGIKGLTQFLEQNFKFQLVNLNEFEALVIDGNNICGKLYQNENLDWKMGGEYSKFSVVVKTFFDGILRAGVKPIVVVDGLREAENVDESRKRREELNSKLMQKYGELAAGTLVIPILALPTFVSAVKELGIELRVSAGEGDQLVAAISNSTPKCPVLASDSDYFMFELQNGYIPLKYLNHSTGICSLYHMDQLKAQFSIPDSRMRLLIPTIHGNDFIPSQVEGFQFHKQTLSDLQRYKSCEDYLSLYSSLRPKYEIAQKQYCVTLSPTELIQTKISDCPHFSTSSPASVDLHFCLIRITKTRVNVLNVLSNVVEKISQKNVWECSQYIRTFIYGFLEISEVQELLRKEDSPKLVTKSVESKFLDPPVTIAMIAEMEIRKREGIVLEVLKCHKMAEKYKQAFGKLPLHLKLPVATVFYWRLSSDIVTDNLLRSLLLCFTTISNLPRKKYSHENVHAFSQWQCVYGDALALNYIAGSPLEPSSPACLFSGETVLYYSTWDSEYLASKFTGELLTMFEIVASARSHQREVTKSDAATPADRNRFSVLSNMTD